MSMNDPDVYRADEVRNAVLAVLFHMNDRDRETTTDEEIANRVVKQLERSR